VKSFLVVTMAFVLAQPAAATSVVQLQPLPARCTAADCRPTVAAPAADDSTISPGQMVAGLAGLLILGLVFGRRRSVLPQVFS
jgi:hypothetical protein